MTALERLIAWNNSAKAHAVDISHGNGYGADCWVVQLWRHRESITAAEVGFMTCTEADCPPNVVFAVPPWIDSDEDWPGLEKTIHVAIDRAEKLWPRSRATATGKEGDT